MKSTSAGSRSPVVNAYAGPFGILAMALTWGAGWGLGLGGLMEIVDPSGEIADIWFSVLGIPGFVTGMAFWIILRLGERGRRIEQLPPARLAAWGAITGGVLGTVLFSLGFAGPMFNGLWLRSLVVIGAAILLCTLSAVVPSILIRSLSRASHLGSRALA